ncbi:Methionyl-tRNA formyltransferase [Massospora cicadina]|nr:Methionyl-tRNA formyltransferase [Massospora cicadina]
MPHMFGDWELPPTNSNAPYNLAMAVSFGYFLPKRILGAFTYGGVNVHPSLLPKYRGAAPIIHTLWNGDPVMGVTIQNLSVEQYDAGRILNQQETPVSPTEDYLSLHNRLGEKGADMLVETIEHWDHFQSHSWEQDPREVSYAPKLDRSFSFVDWESDSPAKIMRRHLALSGVKYPLSSYFWVSYDVNEPFVPRNHFDRTGEGAILIRLSDPSYQLRVTGIKLQDFAYD